MAKTAKTPEIAVDPSFAPLVEAFATDRAVTLEKMMNSPGLKVGGKIFAMMSKQRLVVKLSKERVDSLVAAGSGERFDPGHGRLMKEWVAVGADAKGTWLALAREARQFVAQASVGDRAKGARARR